VIENFGLYFIFLLFALIIFIMGKALWTAHGKVLFSSHMILPQDFFSSLMLLYSIWSLIFLLLATKDILKAYQEIIIIISAFLSVFLLWWYKKS
jgi:hypothetical protein